MYSFLECRYKRGWLSTHTEWFGGGCKKLKLCERITLATRVNKCNFGRNSARQFVAAESGDVVFCDVVALPIHHCIVLPECPEQRPGVYYQAPAPVSSYRSAQICLTRNLILPYRSTVTCSQPPHMFRPYLSTSGKR